LKVAKYKPSPIFIAAVVMGASIFLLGGGIYNILEEPLAILPIGGRFLSFLPRQLHDQFIIESLGIMILYALGALGLLLIYHSTRYVRNPRQVSLLSKISVALFLVAIISVEAILFMKLHY
jgi:hypothetical protein